jgi:hypothetical protein
MSGPQRFNTLRANYAGEALSTWIIGHRGLFVLCQELNRSLKAVHKAVQAGDKPAIIQQLGRVSAITRACGVGFKLTGAMSPDEYSTRVVPAMVAADPAFTGLWSRDHSAMLQQVGRTFRDLDGFEVERASVKLMTASMVAQHVRVCETFARGRPSLNAQARSGMASNSEPGYIRLRDTFAPHHIGAVDRRS